MYVNGSLVCIVSEVLVSLGLVSNYAGYANTSWVRRCIDLSVLAINKLQITEFPTMRLDFIAFFSQTLLSLLW